MIATALEIRDLRSSDWPEVARIFEEGIRADATFATTAPSWESWNEGHTIQLVAEVDGEVVGWAALAPTSARECYRGVHESSVYVAKSARRSGIGQALMTELIARSEREGIWTLEALMFPENEASLALHKKLGFRVVGVRERIGLKNGEWRDTVLLERRSEEVT